MHVRNIHERLLLASPAEVGALIDSLAGPDDRLWPGERWPALRLDGRLAAGATGGHGPIRYTVESYVPGRLIRFRFTRPSGFNGTHSFIVEPAPGGAALLRHDLEMRATGTAWLSWPVVFRPLHNALIEDALDRASAAVGGHSSAPRWSPWVHALRAVLRHSRSLRFASRNGSEPPARHEGPAGPPGPDVVPLDGSGLPGLDVAALTRLDVSAPPERVHRDDADLADCASADEEQLPAQSIVPLLPEHWPAVEAIYAEGIATRNATFETATPGWAAWDAAHLPMCRYVLLRDRTVAGWAALSPVSRRAVYQGVAELSVYVAECQRGRGFGAQLMNALITGSEQAGIWTLQATVFPENETTLRLHERFGFREVGRREKIARLDGEWRDTLLLERRSRIAGIPADEDPTLASRAAPSPR
jgi:L-amino acid N-acyltransferase YncA